MQRRVIYSLLALTLFLVLFPLAIPKPGLPVSLKADEPAYYLAALSLARDRDLRVQVKDIRRLNEEFPYIDTHNLILMSDDGWRHVYFGKPYIYSLFAAPFAGLFGADGMVAFNMLMMMGLVWMGASYLRQYNSDGLAAVHSAGFFLLSGSFPYVFWLHPEIFNMFGVGAALYLAFRQPDPEPEMPGFWRSLLRRLDSPTLRALLSGGCLALATYNKPMLGILGFACLVIFWRRDGFKGALRWLVGAAVVMALVAGASIAFTGHASAYLGVQRQGVNVHDTNSMPVSPEPLASGAVVHHQGSWSWMFRLPTIDWSELAENSGYFLWGRHTGLIPYQPFAVLSLLIFLFVRPHSVERWTLFAATGLVALTFLIWIPFNWHGGGGFVGNRYFVGAVPAFLFLVTTVRPRWMPLLGYAAAGVLVGPMVFTPLGAPVAYPTLQSHVRGWPFSLFPLELTLEGKIPGYRGAIEGDLYFWGRKDVFEPKGGAMWFFGGARVEVWVKSYRPVHEAVFQVVDFAPGNRVTLELPGDRQVLGFPDPLPGGRANERVTLHPTHANHVKPEGRHEIYYYRLIVSTLRGHRPPLPPNQVPGDFSAGAVLYYLGDSQKVHADVYEVEWGECGVADHVKADAAVPVRLVLTNASSSVWPVRGATRVRIGWRWIDARGQSLPPPGERFELPHDVRPGQSIELNKMVTAPGVPGTYRLQFEPVYERIAWFGTRTKNAVCSATVEVTRNEKQVASSE